jgi:hypothetical protein
LFGLAPPQKDFFINAGINHGFSEIILSDAIHGAVIAGTDRNAPGVVLDDALMTEPNHEIYQ